MMVRCATELRPGFARSMYVLSIPSPLGVVQTTCGVHGTPQYANFDDFQGCQTFPFAKDYNGDWKFWEILDDLDAQGCQFGYFVMYLWIINHNKAIRTDLNFRIVPQNFELITDLVLKDRKTVYVSKVDTSLYM